MTPLVSIVLLAHRLDDYFLKALESIERQTFRDFETVVVVNGPSRIALAETVRAREKLNPIVVSAELGDIAALANKGMEAARGEFICRFDSDDLCAPERLQKQVSYLRAHPEIDVLGGQAEIIDGRGEIIGALYRPLDHRTISQQLPFRCSMLQPTVMMRGSRVRSVSGYREGSHAEDWDLWIRLVAANARFANLPDALIQYRMHGSQTTHQRFRQLQGELRVLWKAFGSGYGVWYLIGFWIRALSALAPRPAVQTFRRRFGKWQSRSVRGEAR